MRKLFLVAGLAFSVVTGAAHAQAPELGDDTITVGGRVANTSGGSYHPAKAGIFMLC